MDSADKGRGEKWTVLIQAVGEKWTVLIKAGMRNGQC